ncbi:MAG: SpoIID/LytB domain-containing protein [Nitrospirae bacterium]|nr:SpoIID/LytB domain-containing protein [Nitrospirota bacterium]
MLRLSSIIVSAVLAATLLAGQARADESVRILVMDGLAKIRIQFPEGYEVDDRTGVLADDPGDTPSGPVVIISKDNGPPNGVRIFADKTPVNINEFSLTGVVEVGKNAKGLLRIINEIPIEDYVRAVVGEEMPASWPIEALKAQAVVTRTYALFRKTKHDYDGYDLCSSVNSQVFTGDAREKDGPARAARDTEGEVLGYNGALVETLYHSTCGGITEDAADVWDLSRPYLRPEGCSCSKESPYAAWEKRIPQTEIEKALCANGYPVAGITAITVTDRSDTGRAKAVSIQAVWGRGTIKAADLRRIIGYSKVPSTCFMIKKDGEDFVFSGKGAGHGVGMCQWGAKVMAENGKGYREILAHYYKDTVLSRIVSQGGR